MTKKVLSIVLETVLITLFVASIAGTSPFIYRKMLRSYASQKTVQIELHDEKVGLKGGGTGFYVKADSGKTYIMSNRHICDIESNEFLKIRDSRNKLKDAHVIEISKESDLCLIEPVEKIEGFDIAKSIGNGDTIYYIGHPRLQPITMVSGEAVGYRKISVFAGIVSNKKDELKCTANVDMAIEKITVPGLSPFQIKLKMKDPNPSTLKVCIQTNKALFTTFQIYPGASGSPIIDAFGRLVSVVYAGPGDGGWGWGVPLTQVKKFLKGR